MKLFTVTNHTPLQLRDWLIKNEKLSPEDFYIHPLGTKFPERPKRKYSLILNLQDLYRNVEVLNSKSYKDYVVFLFCAPFRAIELENSTMLDCVQNERNIFKFDFQNLKIAFFKKSLAAVGGKVERQVDKYLYKIVEDVREGSFLTPLMTFLYKLNKQTHQIPVKEVVVDYIWNGKPIKEGLKIRGVELGPKHFDQLGSILTGPGAVYRDAIKFYKKKRKEDPKYAIKSLEKLYKVQAYELTYLRKIKDSIKVYGSNSGKTTGQLAKKTKDKS
jgi:hypothetical protein